MEGLIPLALKALKRNKVRRQYRCLSVGAAQTFQVADFYDFGAHRNSLDHDQYGDAKLSSPHEETRGHRRFASTGDYGITGGYNFNYHHNEVNNNGGVIGSKYSPPNRQIIKRYGSHKMFSCITGTV